jgi:hypothetical protein
MRQLIIALCFIACASAGAQTIYRNGNSYSYEPVGKPVEIVPNLNVFQAWPDRSSKVPVTYVEVPVPVPVPAAPQPSARDDRDSYGYDPYQEAYVAYPYAGYAYSGYFPQQRYNRGWHAGRGGHGVRNGHGGRGGHGGGGQRIR